MSQLCQSGWGENRVGPLHSALRDRGSWLLALVLLSWGELFLARKLVVGAEQCWLMGWDDEDKMKMSAFSFKFFVCLFHCVA